MDPNLFHLDFERTLEALVGIIVLSFLVERAFAFLFESRWWISRFEDARVGTPPGGTLPKSQTPLPARKYPIKELLVFILALAICLLWDFDALSIILLTKKTQLVGIIVTAAIVAGGSKGSIALFRNLLHIMSSAEKERQEFKKKDMPT